LALPSYTVRVPKHVDVARLRHRLGRFARTFGLDVTALHAWEQGRRRPDRAARVLLAVIAKEPQAVLAGARRPIGGFNMARNDGMQFTIRPLTANLWPALEDLFDTKGPCSRCWCMGCRIGPAFRKRPREENKAAFREIVERGPPPGLLAFAGDLAVGWCQLTPRDAVPWLDRAWRLRRVDDTQVWSLSCFYVRIGHRKRGVTSALIAEALKVAKRGGAPALEAYPLDAELTPSASSTGFATTFVRAGFTTVARHVPSRPIMRHDLKALPRSR
jgi:GNAT superfamily N-acetyltransferase